MVCWRVIAQLLRNTTRHSNGRRSVDEARYSLLTGLLQTSEGGQERRQTMEDLAIQAALERHWTASAAGDLDAEHEIYHDDVVVEYPSLASGSAAGITSWPCVCITRPSWDSPSA